MNDKELADKIISCGAAEGPNNYGAYALVADVMDWMPVERFVRDARVAMAMMKKVDAHFIERLTEKMWAVRSDKPYGEGKTREWFENESLERAINEACAAALS